MQLIAITVLFLAELATVGWERSSLSALVRSPQATIVDLGFALIDLAGLREPATLVMTLGLYGALGMICQHFPSLDLTTGWFWGDITLQLVIVDFCGYWLHRLQHTRLLWWAHKLHHDKLPLSPLTNYRHNPIEAVFRPLATAAPALILSVHPLPWLVVLVIYKFQGLYLHSALSWRHGKLSWLLVSPTAHCFHHAQNPSKFNRNFGAIFMLWDHLFSTAIKNPH